MKPMTYCHGYIIRAMSQTPAWPDALDAVIAAPHNHHVLFENDAVRVLDTTVRPGETVPLHTHRWPSSHYC
jgi:quercetin dioxygenase-like cupin family protein